MDHIALSLISAGKAQDWTEIVHPEDRRMACVADVHTANDLRPGIGFGHSVLEEAVGDAHEIYVVVPIQGKLYLTRGAVFSYFEFLRPAGKRLDDAGWQKLLDSKQRPPQPVWVKAFTVQGSAKPKERPIR